NVNINGTTTSYNQVYGAGDTYMKIGTLGGNILIGTNAHVVIWLTTDNGLAGTASFNGNNQVTIAPGASLTIYVGTSFSVSGNAAINNLPQAASKFPLLGLPSSSADNAGIQMTGNGNIAGTIYAPDSQVKLGGGGSSTNDLSGSIMAKAITLTGHMNVHYD